MITIIVSMTIILITELMKLQITIMIIRIRTNIILKCLHPFKTILKRNKPIMVWSNLRLIMIKILNQSTPTLVELIRMKAISPENNLLM